MQKLTNWWRNREPVFGPNAWPLVVQLAFAVPVGLATEWLIGDHVYNAAVNLATFIGIP